MTVLIPTAPLSRLLYSHPQPSSSLSRPTHPPCSQGEQQQQQQVEGEEQQPPHKVARHFAMRNMMNAAGVLDGLRQFERGEQLLQVGGWVGSMHVCCGVLGEDLRLAPQAVPVWALDVLVFTSVPLCTRAHSGSYSNSALTPSLCVWCCSPCPQRALELALQQYGEGSMQHINVTYGLAQHYRRRGLLDRSIELHEQVGVGGGGWGGVGGVD